MRSLLVLALLASTASADIKTNKRLGVSVDIPHDWKLQADGDQVFATDANEEAAVMFAMSNFTTPKAVAADVDRMMVERAKDVRWGPQKQIVVNGHPAIAIVGTGKTGDVRIITHVVIAITKNKGVFVLGIVAANVEATHRSTLQRIAGSMKFD